MNGMDTDNMLSVLDSYMLETADDIAGRLKVHIIQISFFIKNKSSQVII